MAKRRRERAYVMLYRDRQELLERLLADPNAWAILTRIALDAVRVVEGVRHDGLHVGQCWMRGPDAFGMSRKAYRCARERLEEWGLVRFDAHNGRGSVATLLDDVVFDINPMQLDRNGQYLMDFSEGSGASSRAGLSDGMTGSCDDFSEHRGKLGTHTNIRGKLFRQNGASSGASLGQGLNASAAGSYATKNESRGKLQGRLRASLGAISSRKQKNEEESSSSGLPAVGGHDDDDFLREELADEWGFGPGLAERVCSEHQQGEIRSVLENVREQLEGGRQVRNVVGYVLAALRNGSGQERVSDAVQQQREAEAEARREQECALAIKRDQAAEDRRVQAEAEDRRVQELWRVRALRDAFGGHMRGRADLVGEMWREHGIDSPVVRGEFLAWAVRGECGAQINCEQQGGTEQ